MRNPNRLNSFYEEFKTIHKEQFPDWRFGQLICNFFGWFMETRDPFYMEEDEMLRAFKKYVEDLKGETNEL